MKICVISNGAEDSTERMTPTVGTVRVTMTIADIGGLLYSLLLTLLFLPTAYSLAHHTKHVPAL